jgi:MFS family permease
VSGIGLRDLGRGTDATGGLDVRVRVLAVATAFLLNGISFGTWAARIPAVKAQTGLDEAGLGFALLGASIGAVLTMTFGGALGSKLGTHVMTPASMIGCAAMLPAVGWAWNFASLTLALLLFGICQGTMDVCMNANGMAVEHAGSGPIMSRLHASWSIGAFLGALVSSQLAALGVAVLPEFAVVGAAIAVVGVALRFAMLPDRHTEGGGLRLPTGPLALLGLLCLFGLMAEGSATDWSGVYMQRTMDASEGLAGLAVTAFAGSMALARLVGDRLTVVLGPARLVGGGAGLATVGLGLALAVPVPPLAIAGFGLMGLGLAAVIPTLFRAAGSQPGVPASVGIAAVSTMGYAGGLIGPPVIGTVAQAATLRGSLAIVLVLLVVLTIAGCRALAGRAAPTSAAPRGSSIPPER